MLKVSNLEVAYGDIQVVFDVSLEVGEGELISLVGPNGAGKTTTVRAIAGIVPPLRGRVEFLGREISGMPSHEIVPLGLVHVPEGRLVFPSLTVEENLDLGAFHPRARARRSDTQKRVFELFPVLDERRRQLAGTLSGGEQQMLAIGRGLMGCPRLIVFDEPSLGLAPILVREILKTIRDIVREGITVLLIEENVQESLKLADRGYVIETGRIVQSGNGKNLLGNEHIKRAYLGL
jgi:branched-chain amino acid transport system ATP-binding protein